MATKRKTRSKPAVTKRRPAARPGKATTGNRSKRSTNPPRQSIGARPRGPEARPTAPDPNPVEIDEPRERVGGSTEAFDLQTSEGTDDLAEELAESYVENVTGADDAASEHRTDPTPEERGGPFILTNGETEYADDVDESNPIDATVEPLPKVTGGKR